MPQQPDAVHYLPIATTVLSAMFFLVLMRAWLVRRSGPHLLWWAAGIFAYGLGTGLESAVTLYGNTVALNKAWYIAGALLGGYPLAQGSVFLLLKRRTAMILTAASLPFIVVTALLVIASPVNAEALEPHRPGGAILGWQWVRLMTPFINLYAVIFLIGGAILSAWRYWRQSRAPFGACPECGHRLIGQPVDDARDRDPDGSGLGFPSVHCPECGSRIPLRMLGMLDARAWEEADERNPDLLAQHERNRAIAGGRAIGNALIAFGAILPGVGGGMAKAGMVEGLYVGELVGLLFIWAGYAACVMPPRGGSEKRTVDGGGGADLPR